MNRPATETRAARAARAQTRVPVNSRGCRCRAGGRGQVCSRWAGARQGGPPHLGRTSPQGNQRTERLAPTGWASPGAEGSESSAAGGAHSWGQGAGWTERTWPLNAAEGPGCPLTLPEPQQPRRPLALAGLKALGSRRRQLQTAAREGAEVPSKPFEELLTKFRVTRRNPAPNRTEICRPSRVSPDAIYFVEQSGGTLGDSVFRMLRELGKV